MHLRILYLGILLVVFNLSGFSQARTISGNVKSAIDSLPLIGATIVVKGTTNGTTVDFDGNYSLNVSSPKDTLVFGFVGMDSKEIVVGNLSVIDVVLSEKAYEVSEVVVTALGISRQSKSLGYSVDQIDGDDLVDGNDRSFLNALQGKVAGVNISSASGAPGSSSRVMIRGVSSLGRSNEPLYIIDGVQVSNGLSGSTSINGGTDFGNGANDINPDDIASMTVLKGSAGTALYGSKAANGVIIITTKKGKANNKPQITFSSSMSLEEPLKLVSYQNEFGQGINGEYVAYENMSWGPALDGESRLWGHKVDSAYRVKPYSALPSNVKEFFDIGRTYNNSISVTGGSDVMTYYASYSNLTSDGIFPTDADSYDRNTISLRGTADITNRLKTSVSINLVRKENSFVATGQGGQSVYNQIMQTPRDISLLELRDLDNKFNTTDNFYSLYTINPYYILNNSGNTFGQNRMYGNFGLEYKVFKNLMFKSKLGIDLSHSENNTWRPVIIPEGNNEFAAIYEIGRYSTGTSKSQLVNMDFLLTYEKQFSENWNVNIIAGASLYQSGGESLYTQVNGLSVADFYRLSNTNESPISDESEFLKRTVGAYSNIDFSYKSWFFLSVSGRNDWSSTFEKSFFYPGANTGIVFTDLIPGVKNILSFGKLRLGVAQTGNDAPIYSADNSYFKGAISDGYSVFRFPINNVNSYALSNLLGNKELDPELTTEYEVGVDLRFFQNRIGLDASYYNNNIKDLIWAAPISPSSGFTSKIINLGEMKNEGVELLITITPIKNRLITWDMAFNYSKNRNILLSLNESTERVVLTGFGVSGGQQINYIAVPDRPVGIFEAREVLHDQYGRIVVDNQGIPRSSDSLVEYGNGNYDFTFGITNSISIAGLTISGSLDIRQGGIMYSRTKDISAWAGTSIETLYNNRQPFIVPNSVVETGTYSDGSPIYKANTKPIDAEQLGEFWGAGGYESDGFALIDKSFVKLREVSVSYALPSKIITKLPISGLSINVVGKNLFLWTPEGQYYIDPEVTTFGNDLTANFGEYGATPSIRSVSFGLRIIL